MTRLILIELEEPSTADGMAKAVSVWELPSAEELGRAAAVECAYYRGSIGSVPVDCYGLLGQRILAALRTAAPAPGKS